MKKALKTNQFLLLLGSILLLSSCSDTLNTEPITDEITTAQDAANPQVLKDAISAENAMKNCNKIFGDEFWQFDYFFAGDAGADVAYAGADQEAFFQIDQYRIISTNYVVERDWGHMTDYVNRCNLIINYANTVPDLSQTRKDEMIGEASLYRALTRFMGVQLWGDFPLVNATVTSISSTNFNTVYPSLYPSRKPIEEVYAAIISDCEVALAKAPDASYKFRANKGAASALLAKVYATKPNADWGKVNQYCDAIINGGYTLMPVYNNLFDNQHEGNQESIWEANGDGPGGLINAWCTSVFQGQDWKKFNVPSHALYNAFVANADTQRRTASIKRQNTSFADPYWPSYQFPYANKMRKTDGTQNFYVFRLADIILLKAEALAHTGDLVNAMTLVNQIRSRVALPNVSPASSQAEAIDKILQERYLELAFEGQRWFDLKRTATSIATLSEEKDGNGVTLPFASSINQNRLLWPIPQSILDNNPNLSQNPGY